jgi:putative lipoprotein (rSAM/lipoprotein system)
MKPCLLIFFPILSILLLSAFSQSSAQTPQRDNRPRAASIGGRVTIAGKPAVNAAIILAETDLKSDADGGSDAPILHQSKTMTDGDGRYLFSGLDKGRYVVSAMLNALVVADSSGDPAPRRTVILDEGKPQGEIDFALIRGGVITGRVIDDEGAPLIAQEVQLYTVDEQGQKREYRGRFTYDEIFVSDDRGVYRIYGLPPGRYIISAGGEYGSGPLAFGDRKFVLTYHPNTTDEKEAWVIEIKEGSEVTDVDIRFGRAKTNYEAKGRVVDKETGQPVPGIHVYCLPKFEKDAPNSGYSRTVIADEQGNFKLLRIAPGRYQAAAADLGEVYTSEAAEFEITNDNVSGVEVKAFRGASVSGFVVIDGSVAATVAQFPFLRVLAGVTPPSGATGDANLYSILGSTRYASVDDDGSFVVKGLRAGRVSFALLYSGLRINQIERDGVDVKDAIEVKAEEKIAGVRIVAYQPQGRIRGKVQIARGALPDGSQLEVNVKRLVSADESKPGPLWLPSLELTGSAFVDKNGRFVIEGVPAGEYDLSTSAHWIPGVGRQSVNPPVSNQRVTVRENEETSVTITIGAGRTNRRQQREERQ